MKPSQKIFKNELEFISWFKKRGTKTLEGFTISKTVKSSSGYTGEISYHIPRLGRKGGAVETKGTYTVEKRDNNYTCAIIITTARKPTPKVWLERKRICRNLQNIDMRESINNLLGHLFCEGITHTAVQKLKNPTGNILEVANGINPEQYQWEVHPLRRAIKVIDSFEKRSSTVKITTATTATEIMQKAKENIKGEIALVEALSNQVISICTAKGITAEVNPYRSNEDELVAFTIDGFRYVLEKGIINQKYQGTARGRPLDTKNPKYAFLDPKTISESIKIHRAQHREKITNETQDIDQETIQEIEMELN